MWGIHRWPVNSPHKGQWRGTLKFSFICAWINGRVNNREAGDLRRHRAHYDVIVMICSKWSHCQYLITGSDNGLVPTRHQAISWISLDQVPWRQITPMSQYIKIARIESSLNLTTTSGATVTPLASWRLCCQCCWLWEIWISAWTVWSRDWPCVAKDPYHNDTSSLRQKRAVSCQLWNLYADLLRLCC